MSITRNTAIVSSELLAAKNLRTYYGVKGDGTDETTKIQAAIDDVSETGGALYCPKPPVAYGASGLTLTNISLIDGVLNTCRFHMFGDGQASIFKSVGTNPIFTIGDDGGQRLHDVIIELLHFDGNYRDADSNVRATTCIRIENSSRVDLAYLRIYNAANDGILYTDESYGKHSVTSCMIRENKRHGINVDATTDNGNALTVLKSSVLNNGLTNAGAGIYLRSGSAIQIIGSDIEGNESSGIDAADIAALFIHGNYFEAHDAGAAAKNKTNILIGSAYEAVSIVGNHLKINDNNGQEYGVYAEASQGLRVADNDFEGTDSTGTGLYCEDGSYDYLFVKPNRYVSLDTNWRLPASGTIGENDYLFSMSVNMIVGAGGVEDVYVIVPHKSRLFRIDTVMNENLSGATDETLTIANQGLTTVGTLVIAGSTLRNNTDPAIG